MCSEQMTVATIKMQQQQQQQRRSLTAFRPSGIYLCTWSERAWTCRRLPLGPTLSFRALCTAAISISCSARFVEVIFSGVVVFNTDYGSSEPLKTLVML